MNLWTLHCAQTAPAVCRGEERKRRNGTYVLSPSAQRGVCHCAGLYGSVPGSGCRAGGNHRHPQTLTALRQRRCSRRMPPSPPDGQRRLRRNVGERASGRCSGAAGCAGGAGACEKDSIYVMRKRHDKLTYSCGALGGILLTDTERARRTPPCPGRSWRMRPPCSLPRTVPWAMRSSTTPLITG